MTEFRLIPFLQGSISILDLLIFFFFLKLEETFSNQLLQPLHFTDAKSETKTCSVFPRSQAALLVETELKSRTPGCYIHTDTHSSQPLMGLRVRMMSGNRHGCSKTDLDSDFTTSSPKALRKIRPLSLYLSIDNTAVI